MMREKINFNAGWFFHLGEVPQKVKKITAKTGTCGGPSNLSAEEGFVYKLPPHIAALFGSDNGNFAYNIEDRIEGKWEAVNLPHDWMIRQDYVEPQAAAAQDMVGAFNDQAMFGYLPDNVGYYRKIFSLPQEASQQRIVIEFEGVMRDTIVWVNGSYIGSHLSGYTGFAFDLSEYLFFGDEGQNVILVKTDSSGKEGWWGEGAGIYRNVWLYRLNPLHVKRHGTFIYSEDITPFEARVIVETEIENNQDHDCSFIVRQTMLTQEKVPLLVQEKALSAVAGNDMSVTFAFELVQPELWELERPYLYAMITEILQDRQIVDNYTTTFGIRDIQYKQQGLLINGKLTEIKGVCEHQDFAGVGIALTPDIIDFKLRRIIEMGANAYRSAHHPATDYLLQACDRLGILVLNENRRLEVSHEGLRDLEELIKSSRNHPSVFMWSLENEEFITSMPPGKRLLKTLLYRAKKLDPTRLFTVAGQFAKRDIDYVSIPDIAGFNYDEFDARAMLDKRPDLLVMASEDSCFVSTRGTYHDDRDAGVCDSYDTGNYFVRMIQAPDQEISAGSMGGAASKLDLAYSWYHYKNEAPYLGGIFVWTAFDYRGETFPWNWPTINAQTGAMDMCGFAKDAFYYWQSVWIEKPMVHLLPHWNWPGQEGNSIQIDAYSNCDEVELFVNGRSVGRKQHTRGKITSWQVSYEPGEIKIIACNDGRELAEDQRTTTGDPFAIKLEVMHSGKADDLIKAEVVDEKGRVCPVASNHIRFIVEKGEIIGVGNGHPASHEPDVADNRRAFNGLAMVIVRKSGSGTTVFAESDGLNRGSLII